MVASMVFWSQVSTWMFASLVSTRRSGAFEIVYVFDHCSARAETACARTTARIARPNLFIAPPAGQPVDRRWYGRMVRLVPKREKPPFSQNQREMGHPHVLGCSRSGNLRLSRCLGLSLGSFFDQRCNRLRLRNVDGVA